MILADTSIWIDYLDRGRLSFATWLNDNAVVMHPFVVGELSLGNLRNRNRTLRLLNNMPQAVSARHEEVIHFIEEQGLFGRGIGYVDAHLLVSSRLTGATFITLDKRLRNLASQLGLSPLA